MVAITHASWEMQPIIWQREKCRDDDDDNDDEEISHLPTSSCPPREPRSFSTEGSPDRRPPGQAPHGLQGLQGFAPVQLPQHLDDATHARQRLRHLGRDRPRRDWARGCRGRVLKEFRKGWAFFCERIGMKETTKKKK